MEAGHALSSRLGRITISSEAIAQIVAETALGCYGVVGMKGSLRGQLSRAPRRPRGLVVGEAVGRAEPGDRPALAHAVARAARMGARGNSGVILSQIVRGVADVLASSTNGIDPTLTARALRGASDAAYRAVRRPVEG